MNKRTEILEELKAIGVTWAESDPQSKPYSVPKNYFEELPIQLTDSAKAIQNVETLISIRSSNQNVELPNQSDVFVAKNPSKLILMYQKFGRSSLIAACLAGVLVLSCVLFWKQPNGMNENAQLIVPNTIPDTEIILFLESGGGYSESLINSPLNNALSLSENTDELLSDVSDEELMAYSKQTFSTIN
jgi:hypothetical protein